MVAYRAKILCGTYGRILLGVSVPGWRYNLLLGKVVSPSILFPVSYTHLRVEGLVRVLRGHFDDLPAVRKGCRQLLICGELSILRDVYKRQAHGRREP